MPSVSPQNYSDTDRRDHVSSLPELPAPAQAEMVEPEALATEYFVEIPEEEIASHAYALYEARGCEDGHDVEDWFAAKAKIEAGRRFFRRR